MFKKWQEEYYMSLCYQCIDCLIYSYQKSFLNDFIFLGMTKAGAGPEWPNAILGTANKPPHPTGRRKTRRRTEGEGEEMRRRVTADCFPLALNGVQSLLFFSSPFCALTQLAYFRTSLSPRATALASRRVYPSVFFSSQPPWALPVQLFGYKGHKAPARRCPNNHAGSRFGTSVSVAQLRTKVSFGTGNERASNATLRNAGVKSAKKRSAFLANAQMSSRLILA